MRITEEILAQAVSERGGFNRAQLEVLGVHWPPERGWKRLILETEFAAQKVAEFIQLSARNQPRGATPVEGETQKRAAPRSTGNWAGLSNPVDIHLYVLVLVDGHFYVGLTADVERRFRQHIDGLGAEWTRQYRPVSIFRTIPTGTQNERDALVIEDEVTVSLMMQHGVDKVRGGRFCHTAQTDVEAALLGRGHWQKIKQRELDSVAFDTESSWSDALDQFIGVALAWYDAGAPWEEKDHVFAVLYRVTRYRYWRKEFDAALSAAFWGPKGVLPVLLSIKHGRPVSSGHRNALAVLDSALNRGGRGRRPTERLFLVAWRVFSPPVTPKQAIAAERLLSRPINASEQDRQFDDFVSVLLPQMRSLLRTAP